MKFKYKLLQAVKIKDSMPGPTWPSTKMVIIGRRYEDNPCGSEIKYTCRKWGDSAYQFYECEIKEWTNKDDKKE